MENENFLIQANMQIRNKIQHKQIAGFYRNFNGWCELKHIKLNRIKEIKKCLNK